MRYPFDWKTPSGYLAAWLAQCAAAAPVGSIYTQFQNIFFGSVWLFIVIATDITQDVAAFNFNVATKSNKNRKELTKQFCYVLQLCLDAKQ